MATFLTSVFGWLLVGLLHVHYLSRDEVARKKDSLQEELQSLADWVLNRNLLIESSPELNESYLSSKIALLELRLKELYEYYFYIEFPFDLKSLHVSVECIDKDNIHEIQIEMIDVIYNFKICLESHYDDYCKKQSLLWRLKVNFMNIPKHNYLYVFGCSFVFFLSVTLLLR